MRTRSELLAALLTYSLFLCAPIADAYAEAGHSVAVMNLRSRELPKRIVRILEELLAVAVAEYSAFAVTTPDDISAQLGLEDMKDVLGCDDVGCAAEIGGALGTRYLLTGSVRRLGRKLYVTLTLIDTQQQRAIGRSRAKVQNDEDLYEDAINMAVKNLIRSLPSNVVPNKQSDDTPKASVEETRPVVASDTHSEAVEPVQVAHDTSESTSTVKAASTPYTQSPLSLRNDASSSHPSSAPQSPAETNEARPPTDGSVERGLDSVMRDAAKKVEAVKRQKKMEGVSQKTVREADEDGGVGLLATTLFAVAAGTGIAAGYFEYKAWTHNKNATDDTYDGRQLAAIDARKSQLVARIFGLYPDLPTRYSGVSCHQKHSLRMYPDFYTVRNRAGICAGISTSPMVR